MSEREYKFDYDWKTVVMAYWDKYPNRKLDFVKYSKVVGMEIDENGDLRVERIQYVQKYRYIWLYTREQLRFDFQNKVMDLESSCIKKCDFIPFNGGEHIRYQAFTDIKQACEKTLYTKKIEVEGHFSKISSKLSDGFQKGVIIVEENCEKFKNLSLRDWYNKL